MKTVCDLNKCAACMACVDICPRRAITLADSLQHENAVIDEEKCIACGLCENVCQVIHPLPLREPAAWFQGWCTDPSDRRKGSSGAFAFALAKQMISEGGYAASCLFENGEFRYRITSKPEDLDRFRESKYVKSNPAGIYPEVRKLLQNDEKVLFIGLPCHVAGLRNYLGKEYERLITADLICHGSPSPGLLEKFLNQYGAGLQDMENIHFRQKGAYRLTADLAGREGSPAKDLSFTMPGIRDRYSLAFLYGLDFTENCYHCPYAGVRRVSDLTLGDAWGSDLDAENRKLGISLALCQTKKGESLLKRSPVELHEVKIEKAIAANHQLREPFPAPAGRQLFFDAIGRGESFNRAVRKCYPKACFRLDLKNFLLKSGLLKPSGKRRAP